MDPRVQVPAAEVARRDSLHLAVFEAVNDLGDALAQVTEIRSQLSMRLTNTTGPLGDSLRALDGQLAALGAGGGGRGGRGGGAAGAGPPGLGQLQAQLMTLYNIIEDSDAGPTSAVSAESRARLTQARSVLQRFNQLRAAIPR